MDAGNEALVRSLVERGIVRDPRVEAAFRSVPRDLFLPASLASDAFLDAPLPIGEGQTISAPHMVAMMAEALVVQPGHAVLDVGGGSGYHAAILARLVEPGGVVLSIERHPGLVEQARRNLGRLPRPVRVEIFEGDGSMGSPDHAPFDRISVAAAAPALPQPLVEQLRPGGRLVIPVGSKSLQDLLSVRKTADGDALETENLGPVVFVPLLGRHGFSS